MTVHVTSPSFAEGDEIPAKFTCEGPDISPALAWSGVPKGAHSLALVVEDPDAPDPQAPRVPWVHWIAYDISADASGLPEGAALPAGARDGWNDWKKPGYRGPCPAIGRHRYYYRIYALDRGLGNLGKPDKAALDKAMKGHVIAEGALMGTYAKHS